MSKQPSIEKRGFTANQHASCRWPLESGRSRFTGSRRWRGGIAINWLSKR